MSCTGGYAIMSLSIILPGSQGDTLFYRGIGRTDLAGGDYQQIEQSIRNKLYTLEDELVVFPGHGQSTTIIEEKYENPFVIAEE